MYVLKSVALLIFSLGGVLLLAQTATESKGLSSVVYPTLSAHRGGRNIPGYPENALETFAWTHERAPEAWIECDVSMSADSVLFLLHDNTLDRTTTGKGVTALTVWHGGIDTCHLIDDKGVITSYRPPRLEQTLAWAKEKGVILTLDVKRGVPFDRVVAAVQKAELIDFAVIITYNERDAATVYALDPRLMISVSIRNAEDLQRHLNAGIPPNRMIAFTGVRLAEAAHFQQLHDLGIRTIVGVLGNLDNSALVRGDKVYEECIERGGDVLATDRPEAVWRVIDALR
jgi:glycerophosphoryl diester phosphodiesterase